MAEIASAWVSILPSAKGFGKNLNRQVSGETDRAGKSLGSSFGKVFAAAAGAFIGTKVVGFVKDSIGAAGDLEQSIGAIDSVFRGSAKQMHAWSKQAATSVGLSRNEFNELGTLIGAQLKNGGTAMDDLAPKTKQLIGLGADLSSMFGGTTKDAVAALSSALKGERDPIEAYGVSLSQAKVEAEAASLGLTEAGEQLTTQASQAATLSLIYKQTADAQGNFSRETDTLAHQQQVLGAQFADVKAKIGTALLPVVTQLVKTLNSALYPAFRKIQDVAATVRDKLGFLQPVFDKIGEFMKKNPATVKAFAIALGVLAAAIGVVTLATAAFSLALQTTGIPLIIIAIAALVAGLVYAYQHSERFRAIVQQVGEIARAFGGWLRDEVLPVIVALGQKIATNLRPILTQLGETFRNDILPVIEKVIGKFREWQPAIQKVIGLVIRIAASSVALGTKILGKVLPPLIRFAGFLIGTVVPNIAAVIAKVVGFIGSLVKGAVEIGKFAAKVGEKIAKVVAYFTGLPDRVLTQLKDVGTLLWDAGVSIISGLWDGLKSKWEDVKDWFGDVTGWIPDLKGPPAKDRKLLEPAGKLVMEGFDRGLRTGFKAVETTLTKATKETEKKAKEAAKRIREAVKKALGVRAQFASSLRDSLRGEISGLFEANSFGFINNPSTALAGIVARMKSFATKLRQMRKAGIPSGLISEVAALGSTDGTKVADAFLSTSKGERKALRQSYSDFQSVTRNIGNLTANAVYGTRKQVAREARQNARDREANASAIGKHVKNALAAEPLQLKINGRQAGVLVFAGEQNNKKRG